MLYSVSWGVCPGRRKKETIFLVLQIKRNAEKYFGVLQEIPRDFPDSILGISRVLCARQSVTQRFDDSVFSTLKH